MASLLPHQIDELVDTTFNVLLKKKHWVDISLDLQFYLTAERFLRAKKRPMRGGPKMIWHAQVDNTRTARFTGLYARDQYEVKGLTVQAEQQWALTTCNYTYDIDESVFQGDDQTTMIEDIKVREHSMMNSWFELLEEAFWTAPASSTEDPQPLYGIPFWIQKSATQGFNGGNPSGFSSGAANIDVDSYSRWKNYTFGYDGISRDDFINKWLTACEFCNFQAPHNFNRLDGKEPNWSFYTTWDVLESLHKFLDSRNDNLTDIAGLAGDATFKGIPVKRVPALDQSEFAAYDSTNPLYGVNWATMDFFFQKQRDMRRKKTEKNDMHNVRVVHTDSSCGLLCKNRRGNFVGRAN